MPSGLFRSPSNDPTFDSLGSIRLAFGVRSSRRINGKYSGHVGRVSVFLDSTAGSQSQLMSRFFNSKVYSLL